ncbi:apolipoprotein D and lipocalin family protein [Sulfitobacter undariae]|uniref:Apolipoprotein D and lipocalin family protein n=1 Tax=Sulfitobacter undariae TaxID=1563671 RepID=A0A7W6GYJ3_9RHOB|nr:lipocalin family protein [Sulfitobacter undariae]MBB3992926.1 apolipoprotein D and lipocalin family protein [Sulfitobacter undariae]
MIRGILAIGLLALGACTASTPTAVKLPGYRDQSALIGVTSRFDEKKFEGVWYVRAGFDPDLGKMAFRMIHTPKGHVMRLGASVCDAAGVCGDYSEDLPVTRLGKGQFRVKMPNGLNRDFWVLWVDEGFRTAVLGNKTGEFGWIVDRSTKGGADRIAAAHEILDFNGYHVSQLKVVK